MKQFHLTTLMIADLCKQLALLLRAGVPTGDALYLLAEEETSAEYKTLLTELAAQVENGVYLSDALSHSEAFPGYVAGLLQVGETAGRMEETLLSLSQYYEEQDKLSRRLRSALTYPVILLFLMLIVIVVLLTRVLPVFNDVYASLGGSLTGLAGGLLALGNFLNAVMPFLCILLGLIVVAVAAISLSHSLQDKLLTFWQRHFGHKGISRQINDARFAQALAMTLSSGLPLEEGVSMASALIANDPHAAKRRRDCLDRLTAGEDLAASLSASGLLPAASCKMLALGLRAGHGDVTMSEIAGRLSDEARNTLDRKVAMIEPALVIITSLLVGGILLSVMLPLMNIMKAIG